jgi:adenine-specific DNA-methyltransferase
VVVEAADGVSQVSSYGEVFTRRWVVEVLLDLAEYTVDRPLYDMHLVEPSCGSGAFLIPAVDRLLQSLGNERVEAARITDAIAAWDIQLANVRHCRAAVEDRLLAAGFPEADATALATSWVRNGDYLLSDPNIRRIADVVIGNPPYIRLEDVGDDVQAHYRARWRTMGGRADIYVGFFEKGLASLKDGGKLAFICADRWMRNQYGAALRTMVAGKYSVDSVWTMHDVDAFESFVSAYPAITVISRRPQGKAVVADTTGEFGEAGAKRLVDWTLNSERPASSGRGYEAHRLPHWFPGDEMWPSGSPERLALIEHLTDQFGPLHDEQTGTKVSIGIATGADQVFVVGYSEPPDIEDDRLLKLSMVRDLRSGTFTWSQNLLVNPWAPDGSPVDLDKYPRLAAYFDKHRVELSRRYIAKNGKRWYQTIDKVHHDLTDRPKLLIQDMRTSINPVLDPGGYYPHHNLYYVVSTTWDMEVLGGLLLSRIAQAFIEAYCVRMRGNTLRFQAQYLKKIRVPKPGDISADVAEALRVAFRERDVTGATRAALDAYKLDQGAL